MDKIVLVNCVQKKVSQKICIINLNELITAPSDTLPTYLSFYNIFVKRDFQRTKKGTFKEPRKGTFQELRKGTFLQLRIGTFTKKRFFSRKETHQELLKVTFQEQRKGTFQ